MLEGRRVKRWAPKVFSGCQTCKRRRIKCDETKPSCERCARSGLVCEGYQPPTTRIFDPTRRSSDQSPSPEQSGRSLSVQPSIAASSPSPGPAALPLATPQDQRAFDHFQRNTSLLISVYSHPPFWTSILPRATQQHAAVSHSVLALAVWHHSLAAEGFLSDETYERIFTHYSAAISAMTQSPPSVDIVLMTCILFWVVGTATDRGPNPYSHVEAAIKILDEFKSMPENRSSPHWAVIVEDIEPALRKAELHIASNLFDDSALDRFNVPLHVPPVRMANLEEAAEHLRDWLRQVLGLINDNNRTDASQIRADVGVVELRLARFLGFFHKLNTPTDPIQRRLMFVHHAAALGLCRALSSRLGDQEADANGAQTRARWITHEIESILDSPAIARQENGVSSYVTLATLGFIGPLFASAILCKDAAIRARALGLLARLDRVEGKWKSQAAARTAERIVDMQDNEADMIDLRDLAFGTHDNDLTLCNSRTGATATCRIWAMLVDIEEVDLDVLTSVVHNYGYQIQHTIHDQPSLAGS